MEQPLFRDANEALQFTFAAIIRLSSLIAWMLLAMAHLLALVLFLLCVWWFRWEPSEMLQSAQRIAAAKPVETLLAAGVSGLGLAGAYWKLLRRIHRIGSGGWMTKYLTKGLF